ncbi:potassium channel KAT3-like [Agrilus planipennis]|uniref:Potassium channel KAT3-like n=1 Tax=Agrilus planipennis TaxID=224129 RepID=A0A7F5RIQ1_AGRPL|nr:potassium channel KAT3-like [Agrilus planipennis]
MVVLFLILVLTPLLSVSLDGIQKYSKYFVKSVRYLNFFGIADIFLTFCTGVYVHQTRKVVLDPKIVAKKYVLGYFFVDLLSSFPFGMTKEAAFKKSSLTYQVLSFAPFIRILRVANLMKYIDRFRDWRHHSYYKVKVIKLFIIFVLLVMWSSSVMYRVAFHGKSNWLLEGNIIRNLALSILKAVYDLVHVGSDINNSNKVGDIIVSIVCIIVGFVFNLFVVGKGM